MPTPPRTVNAPVAVDNAAVLLVRSKLPAVNLLLEVS